MLEKEEIVSPNLEELKNHYRSIITLLGEDAEREGLLKTPERVAKAMLSLTKGYRPATGEQKVIKTSGFRIQAYAGNNTRQAKNDADRVASRVKEYFPELSVYTSFISPRWLCRVGDFRSIEEADAMMRRLKATGMFKEVSIVRDQINIPL